MRISPFGTIKVVIVLYMNELVPRSSALAETFPAILRRASKNACFAAVEFFSACLSNPHTRRAYTRPVGRFIEELPGSDPTRNLARAACVISSTPW